MSDLDEEFAGRRKDDGPATATWWLLSQAARSIPALIAYRIGVRQSQRQLSIQGHPMRLPISWQDLRYGVRALRRTPAFTIVATATLAVGIGASTASFTAFNAALLAPLPYPDQGRLAVVQETRRTDEISDSYPDFLDWRARARSFEGLASFRGLTVTLTGDGTPERVRGQIVNANLFDVLGVRPAIGRPFGAQSDQPGAAKAVILGYGLWQGRFNGDASVLGRTITIDGSPRDVVGVMPKGFDFPSGIIYFPADIYLSFGAYWDADLASRDAHPGLEAIGLLRPNVSLAQAREELSGIAAQLANEHPDTNRDIGNVVSDAITVIVGDLRTQLRTLITASFGLLLIACANVAGLTLTRTIARRRELAVRSALGASRTSLAAGLLVEHLVLAAGGAAAGIGLAYVLTLAVRPLLADLPRLTDLTPNLGVLAFAVAAMVATTAFFSLAPLLWLRRAPMDPWLRQRGQTSRGWRARQALVGVQLALGLTLVVSATLLSASLTRLQSRSGGIVADGTLTFGLRLPEASYTDDKSVPFYDELYRRLGAGPSVTAVGGISTLPFSGSGSQSVIHLPGQDETGAVRTDVAVVTPGYFRAMGIKLVHGRIFDERDTAKTAAVAIVDERFAARFFPNADPIGQHVQGWGMRDTEIVGVVGHVDNYGVGAPGREELYMPLAQRPRPLLTTVVRAEREPTLLATFARTTIAGLDPDLAISNVRTMRDWVDRTVAGPKLMATLSGAFGFLAVLLAAIGMYGLVGYAVELRRKEAGIRMALGARPGAVVRLMIGGTAGALAGGAVAGLAGAAAAGRLLQEQLFGVGPYDPMVMASATAALGAAALVAGWLPARRAARLSLSSVLQEE